jgi:hypothetical protein
MSNVHGHVLAFVRSLDTQMQKRQTSVPPERQCKYVLPLLKRFKEAGWREDFLHKEFIKLSDRMLSRCNTYDYYTHDELIQAFAYVWYERHEFVKSIRKTYELMGLSRKSAKYLQHIFLPLYNTCYTDNQLIDMGVEYLLNPYIPMTSETTTHPFSPDTIDTWFPLQMSNPKPPIYNFPSKCKKKYFEKFLDIVESLPAHHKENALFYHTTSWKGAESIMEKIVHSRGRSSLDFGLDPGFYLAKSLEYALEFGETKSAQWNNQVAILVFSIPYDIPSHIKSKHLYRKEWDSVVRQTIKYGHSLYNHLDIDEYDLIYGHIPANFEGIKKGEIPRPLNPPKHQLVSKSDAADKFLQTCIVGCLFFQKDVNPPS